MSEDNGVWIVKLVSIILFFFIAAISGTIPIIMKKFRSNQKLLAFSSAFSGGLFLGVGLLHLLPEANIMIDSAIKEDDEEAYPFAYLITIISFSLILFIEKVAAENIHQHYYKDPVKIQDNKQKLLEEQDRLNKGEKIESVYQTENEKNDQQIRQTLNSQRHLASIVSNQNSQISVSDSCQIDKSKSNKMAPFILQVAVGIHAVFEGLSIGIQEEVSLCLGVAIAVACHKWVHIINKQTKAEGFTLGSSFRTAGVNKQIAIPMILVQSTLNPIGIIIGWILAQEGDLVSGIFLSVSVGTFLYISTLEILVEEFSVSRYKFQKYCVYVAALMFVGSFWFIEKLLQVE